MLANCLPHCEQAGTKEDLVVIVEFRCATESAIDEVIECDLVGASVIFSLWWTLSISGTPRQQTEASISRRDIVWRGRRGENVKESKTV